MLRESGIRTAAKFCMPTLCRVGLLQELILQAGGVDKLAVFDGGAGSLRCINYATSTRDHRTTHARNLFESPHMF